MTAAGPEGAACCTDVATACISLGLGCGSPTPLFQHKTAGHMPVFPGAPGLAGLKEQGSGLSEGGLAITYSEPQPFWPSFSPPCSMAPPVQPDKR